MNILPRRAALAITAVVDIAINSKANPVGSKALAARLGLPPRHLEPLLQILVHAKILRGTRGPRGGYELRRDSNMISAGEIARLAVSTAERKNLSTQSALFESVIEPTIRKAAEPFLANLDTITIAELSVLATSKSKNRSENLMRQAAE